MTMPEDSFMSGARIKRKGRREYIAEESFSIVLRSKAEPLLISPLFLFWFFFLFVNGVNLWITLTLTEAI
jgi:hypothetical protein